MNSQSEGRKTMLLRIRDVAEQCAVSARTIRRWMESGLMPKPKKIGGSLRWSREEIQNWIDGGCSPERR